MAVTWSDETMEIWRNFPHFFFVFSLINWRSRDSYGMWAVHKRMLKKNCHDLAKGETAEWGCVRDGILKWINDVKERLIHCRNDCLTGCCSLSSGTRASVTLTCSSHVDKAGCNAVVGCWFLSGVANMYWSNVVWVLVVQGIRASGNIRNYGGRSNRRLRKCYDASFLSFSVCNFFLLGWLIKDGMGGTLSTHWSDEKFWALCRSSKGKSVCCLCLRVILKWAQIQRIQWCLQH